MRRHRAIALAVVITGLLACQYNPFAHLYITTPLDASEVYGTYRLRASYVYFPTPETVGHEDAPSILLMADGRFVALQVPEWMASREFSSSALVDYTGEWRLEAVGRVVSGRSSEPYYGVVFDWPRLRDSAALARDGGKLQLIFTYRDPDLGEALVFERVTAAAG